MGHWGVLHLLLFLKREIVFRSVMQHLLIIYLLNGMFGNLINLIGLERIERVVLEEPPEVSVELPGGGVLAILEILLDELKVQLMIGDEIKVTVAKVDVQPLSEGKEIGLSPHVLNECEASLLLFVV